MQCSDQLKKLIKKFVKRGSAYPDVMPASLAQFILKSGRGRSKLARQKRTLPV